MANPRPRGSSLFSGLLLMFVGVLLLLHNYRGFSIGHVLGHWWPLILIFWGAIKLYERTASNRSGEPGAARISSGEIFLFLGLLSLLGLVVAIDYGRQHLPGDIPEIGIGDKFGFDLNVPTKVVPADARITIRNSRGDISVRSSNEPQIRIAGKKNAKAWSESDAQRVADRASVEIVQNGDVYEVHPTGIRPGDSRVSLDLDVAIPKKAALTIRNERGNITVADMAKPVNISSGIGDIEVRGASGGLTIDGEFYGPIRADKIVKGVRFISQRTDLTLTQLTGHMEAGSGNLEIADAPGNLSLRTNSYDVTIENAGGKVKVDNRNGSVDVRFSTPPKEDIELNNSSAGITLSLPESSSFEILADCHSCDIDSEFSADSLKRTSTESGNSHLEGKYGSGRGPKITLKTSYGSISLRRTSSDIPTPPPPPPRVKAPPAHPKSENQ